MSTPKTGTTSRVPQAIQDIAHYVDANSRDLGPCEALRNLTLQSTDGESDEKTGGHRAVDIQYLAQGGYNDIWLATFEASDDSKGRSTKVIIRVSNEDSLKPHQTRNEVGWLRYIKENHPDIPVPEVYAYSDLAKPGNQPFIAEEYVDGRSLCDVWNEYSEDEKNVVADKIARLVVRLGEIRFDYIGGMEPSGASGPTAEGMKLFKGRDKFHDPACYDIGPYRTIGDYITACYEKEIYYFSHADESNFDEEDFEKISRDAFVQHLRDKIETVKAELESHPKIEPFVLCHNDLQGRNILMKGTEIAAVIDWEFAGSFPLSELSDTGVEVLEMTNDESVEECVKWLHKISDLTHEIAKERGWTEKDLALLTSDGDRTLQECRMEMHPSFAFDPGDDDEPDECEDEDEDEVESGEQEEQPIEADMGR